MQPISITKALLKLASTLFKLGNQDPQNPQNMSFSKQNLIHQTKSIMLLVSFVHQILFHYRQMPVKSVFIKEGMLCRSFPLAQS